MSEREPRMQPTVIQIRKGQYVWTATQQTDKRVWAVVESYTLGGVIRTYAVHDENIAAEVRKTIGTAEV